MNAKEVLRDQIFSIIYDQLKSNKPKEVKITFNRLVKDGNTEIEAKKLIGKCVAVEIFDIMKHKKKFDVKRYVKNLKKLPESPFDKPKEDSKESSK